MSGYSKLFSEIITSSIWSEDDKTRIVWITLLALKDKDGYVPASIPGLANAARVTTGECETSVKKLEEPDKYSRSAENEGRRIQRVDGGWLVLNHQKYRDYLSKDSENIAARERMRRMRERHKAALYENTVKRDVIEETSLTPAQTPSQSPPQPAVEKQSNASKLDALQKEEESSTFSGIAALVKQIKTCRPEFKILNEMVIENYMKCYERSTLKGAVEAFCRDMTNALSVPNMPLKILEGYLRQEQKNIDYRAGGSVKDHRAEKAAREFKEDIHVPHI